MLRSKAIDGVFLQLIALRGLFVQLLRTASEIRMINTLGHLHIGDIARIQVGRYVVRGNAGGDALLNDWIPVGDSVVNVLRDVLQHGFVHRSIARYNLRLVHETASNALERRSVIKLDPKETLIDILTLLGMCPSYPYCPRQCAYVGSVVNVGTSQQSWIFSSFGGGGQI